MMDVTKSYVEQKMGSLIDAFCDILYLDDTIFMENMKDNNLANDDISKYQYWEWPQGVGLYGIWKIFEQTKAEKYLDLLVKFYDRQLEKGFPTLNVNTVAPFLALSFLAEYTGESKYLEPCKESAEWILNYFPRTKDAGFQHLTSDTVNDQELWDDTLFMTVLFLANMGRIMKNKAYLDEAQYQFLLHIKYLQDKNTGLFYHGWTFNGNHNFTEVFWGRGNCWITMVIPEFLSIVDCDVSVKRYLNQTLINQIESLEKYQNPNGMWHTIVDDETSYVESSATCGFAYGILRALEMGLIEPSNIELAQKALAPILNYIDDEGVLNQVSYGTAMGRDSKEFYKNIELKPMPYGQALAILFLFEWQKTE